jgi:hypothetical protein
MDAVGLALAGMDLMMRGTRRDTEKIDLKLDTGEGNDCGLVKGV